MTTLAVALFTLGYGLFYAGTSKLANGPDNGVGFLEALGLTSGGAAATSTTKPGKTVKTKNGATVHTSSVGPNGPNGPGV